MANAIKSSLADIDIASRQQGVEGKLEKDEKKIKEQKLGFFKLLAQQLQNQDPTNPMDTNQMAAQVFALNSLDQQLEANKLLKSINETLNQTIATQSMGNIGKLASFMSDSFSFNGDKVSINYDLPPETEKAEIEIKDEQGRLVYKSMLDLFSHDFTWDGKDAAGNQLKNGKYSFSINAKDEDEKYLQTKSYVSGKIDGVFTESGNFKYSINGQEIDLGRLRSISS
jgi:flagellar basal-body rod modification protein FlgD